jgi:hypothetical protein
MIVGIMGPAGGYLAVAVNGTADQPVSDTPIDGGQSEDPMSYPDSPSRGEP